MFHPARAAVELLPPLRLSIRQTVRLSLCRTVCRTARQTVCPTARQTVEHTVGRTVGLSVRGFKTRAECSFENQASHLESLLPPATYRLLTDQTSAVSEYQAKKRKGSKRGDTTASMLEKVMTYKTDYSEKTVLLCPKTAERIMATVKIHSLGDPAKTEFVDCEGGLCLLATLAQGQFKAVTVLERDNQLAPLHSLAIEQGLDPDTPIHGGMNLAKISSNAMRDREAHLSPLVDFLPRDSAQEEVPSYTMVSVVTQGVMKYLTERSLFRSNPFGEFYAARPEFFFIVAARTYFHLCCGLGHNQGPATEKLTSEEMRDLLGDIEFKAQLMMPYNVAFQIMFDFCLVDVLPREAFFPWKPLKSRPSRPTRAKTSRKGRNMPIEERYEAESSSLFLLYCRPRKPEDVDVRNTAHLSYFLHALFKRKSSCLVTVFEEWCGGAGLQLVQAGYTIFTEVRDLRPPDILPLYHSLVSTPGFDCSTFVIQAEVYTESKDTPRMEGTIEMTEYRIKMKRAMREAGERL